MTFSWVVYTFFLGGGDVRGDELTSYHPSEVSKVEASFFELQQVRELKTHRGRAWRVISPSGKLMEVMTCHGYLNLTLQSSLKLIENFRFLFYVF